MACEAGRSGPSCRRGAAVVQRGGVPAHEYAEQNPTPLTNLAAQREEHGSKSEAAARWLDSLPAAAAAHIRVLEVRSPVRGCKIGQVYRFPLRGGGERFLFLGVISTGRRTESFLNWAFSDDWSGPPVWYPVGCRHGHAKLERAWLLDLVGLVKGWHHALETVEEARASAEAEQRGIARSRAATDVTQAIASPGRPVLRPRIRSRTASDW
jgi:hypothetical protein